MARNRDPFTSALASIRDRIQAGRIAGGAPVIVVDEARLLNLSTTPVREALARLSGEGLVSRAPSGGYVALRLDAAAVRDRYDLSAHYLALGLRAQLALRALHRPPLVVAGLPPVEVVGRLFHRVVGDAGNAALEQAFGRLSVQLERPRRAESRIFDDLAEEAADIVSPFEDRAFEVFADRLARYHQRRRDASALLAAVLAEAEDPAAGPVQDP